MTPRIYVASLSDYNAGRLHGVWIDLDGKDADEVQEEVDAMLATGEPGAEEWAIHDHEGFHSYPVGEWESFAKLCVLAEQFGDDDERGAAVSVFIGQGNDFSDFDEKYKGTFSRETDFAEEWWYELYGDDFRRVCLNVPALRFDVDEYWLMLTCNEGFWSASVEGGVAVFSN